MAQNRTENAKYQTYILQRECTEYENQKSHEQFTIFTHELQSLMSIKWNQPPNSHSHTRRQTTNLVETRVLSAPNKAMEHHIKRQ